MFGRKRRSSSAVIHTLVGEGTRVEGDVRFEGGCHIDGVVHGSVVSDRDPEAFLSISEEGRVEGGVRVPRVAINGQVKGDVHASEMLELGATARVSGNLHYDQINVTPGAEINGQMIHNEAQAKLSGQPATDPVQTMPEGTPLKSQG